MMPALNEEEALPAILAAMPASVDRVVVADNGSTDDTVAVARAAGADVVHEAERGYGAACLAGIRHLASLDVHPEVLVFMDADGSDDPVDIERVAAPILEGGADFVLGVRKGADGDVGTILPHARLGNRLILGLVRLMFRESFADLPPFRAIRFSRLLELGLDPADADPGGWTGTAYRRNRGCPSPSCGGRVENFRIAHDVDTRWSEDVLHTGSGTAAVR
jgi:glycosyltransferase involved in cell wall biosynthesis